MAQNREAVAPAKAPGGMLSTKHGIVVLDFGGQYTQLIARRIREQQVFSAILPCTASVEEIRAQEPVGIVLSGGPSSVYDKDAPVCDPQILELRCSRSRHLLRDAVAGALAWRKSGAGRSSRIRARATRHRTRVEALRRSAAQLRVWNSHGDHVVGLPAGFHVTARTDNAVAAVENPASRFYGVEFHPEVNHTDRGTDILRNFVFRHMRRKTELESRGVYRRDG